MGAEASCRLRSFLGLKKGDHDHAMKRRIPSSFPPFPVSRAKRSHEKSDGNGGHTKGGGKEEVLTEKGIHNRWKGRGQRGRERKEKERRPRRNSKIPFRHFSKASKFFRGSEMGMSLGYHDVGKGREKAQEQRRREI